MALINCPECGHQVSEQAPTCPSCGHPILQPSSNVNVNFNDISKPIKTFLGGAAYIYCLIIGTIFSLGSLMYITMLPSLGIFQLLIGIGLISLGIYLKNKLNQN
ncbi:MAG: zinc-ribbon domain-containing protein [Muribaculaceae bacterium]|nr:zinc-ribbon domain-containing protein [Muribaculaceae bacterium]